MYNNNNLHNTYNKLNNGNKTYLKIMEEIVEYYMTNGDKQSHVKVYLHKEFTTLKFLTYIALILSSAIGIAIIWAKLDMWSINLILSSIPTLIIGYACLQMLNLQKFLYRATDYLNVDEYINTLDPRVVAEAYYNYLEKKNKK